MGMVSHKRLFMGLKKAVKIKETRTLLLGQSMGAGQFKSDRYSFIFLLIFVFGINSCEDNSISQGYTYKKPKQINDGWITASLSSVGMDQLHLSNLMNTLNETDEHRIHSILIVKEGKLVFEEYFEGEKFNLAQYTGETGFNRDDKHNLCSVTNSFTSALLGIAIDKEFIESVDQQVFDFFPEYSELITETSDKHILTLEHLLTMTSGIEWDDETYSYFDSRNDMYQLFNSSDPIFYVLSKDLDFTPGTVFDYSNCNTNVLGEIVHKASDQRLDEFAENYLFSKLGITDFEWQMLPNDVVFASGDLRLRPRDMAKFGLLFLNRGIWEDEQVISQEWIDVSTREHIDPNNFVDEFTWADGYGYQWWRWENINGVGYHAYFASGWGGQWIIISPGMNTVVVSTAGNYYTNQTITIESILVNYIIPSI